MNSLTFALSTKYKQQNLRTLIFKYFGFLFVKINLEGEVGVRAFPSDCLKTFNIWLFKYLTFEWTRLERAKTNNWKCLLKVLSSNLQLNEIGIGYSSNSQITLDWPPAPSLSGSSLKIVQLKFLLSLLNYWINTWSRRVLSPTRAFSRIPNGGLWLGFSQNVIMSLSLQAFLQSTHLAKIFYSHFWIAATGQGQLF